jgi:hypothetical protein
MVSVCSSARCPWVPRPSDGCCVTRACKRSRRTQTALRWASERMRRVVAPSLRRVLAQSDGGCSWPGCTATHWLQAHHIIHVAHGGRTAEDNLLTICPFHHRCVHEKGWKIRGTPHGSLQFFRPDESLLAADRGRTKVWPVPRAP